MLAASNPSPPPQVTIRCAGPYQRRPSHRQGLPLVRDPGPVRDGGRPSFARRRATCVLTVASPTSSSALLRPRASCLVDHGRFQLVLARPSWPLRALSSRRVRQLPATL